MARVVRFPSCRLCIPFHFGLQNSIPLDQVRRYGVRLEGMGGRRLVCVTTLIQGFLFPSSGNAIYLALDTFQRLGMA